MFLFCCGPRARKDDAPKEPNPELLTDETDWLRGGDTPKSYDAVYDKQTRHQHRKIREFIREAEGAMINVSSDTPFQLHAILSDSMLVPPGYMYAGYEEPYPRRGRTRRKRKSQRQRRGSLQNSESGLISSAASAHKPGHRSRSQSRDGSDYSSYSYDDYDDYGEEEEQIDPEEEEHLRKLRGPKLGAQVLPSPAREREIDEEEENLAKEEAIFGPSAGRLPPLQEPSTLVFPDNPEVHPLSQEDEDNIVALSNALWNALEDELRMEEGSKIIRRWGEF